jgi:hypothetical protein
MNKKTLTIFSISLLFANVAIAATAVVPLAVQQLPLEEGGIFAIAAACLVAGIRIIQRKRNR